MDEKGIVQKPITWDDTGLVIFLDGYAYTALFLNGHSEADHICLGEEDIVKAILAGQKPITESKGTKQQKALERILETREEKDARPTETRGCGPKRSRPIGVARHKQANPGRSKTRQRLSRR